MTTAATEVLPDPQALYAVVFTDMATRTLTVRLGDHASGYDKLLWTQAWQQLRQAEEAGWPSRGAPWVYASTPGHYQVTHGLPVVGGQVSFHFPVGTAGFGEVVGKPGLVAVVVIDRGSHRFLSVKFLHRPGG